MRQFGYLIGKHPVFVVLSTFAILLPLLSFFLFYPVEIETDVRRGFAHRNGRSTQEFKAFGNFYNVSMEGMELMIILIESKNPNENPMEMSAQLLNEVERLDKFVTGMRMRTESGRNLSFTDLESSRGSINFLFYAFKLGYDWQQSYLDGNDTVSDSIELDYPVSSIFGNEVTTTSHFFRVERFPEASNMRASQIKSVGSIALWYMVQATGVENRKALREMELGVFDASRSNFSDLFEFHVYGDEIANVEMMRGSERTSRLLIVGLLIMLAFMSIELRDFSWRASIVLTLASVMSPMLAMFATFAIMGWLGVQFNSIMSISPFLVLGIGVDDAFLLLHSWRKHSRMTNRPEEVMEAVMAEVGPSVSITSITNILAFSIGIFSPANQMSSFCLCTTIAVALDFVLEFTVFAPALVLAAPFDEKKKGIQEESENKRWSAYASFLVSKSGRLLCLAVVVFLMIFSYLGIEQMDATFDPQKTFPLDSHLQASMRPINKLYVEYNPLSFIVHRPPDVADPQSVGTFMEMVERIESVPGTYGSNRTILWLRDFIESEQMEFEKRNQTDFEFPSANRIPKFLSDRMMEDKNIVLYHMNGSEVILDSFVFIVVCHGERDWHERAFFIEQIRNLIDEYPQFGVTVFDYDATIFDLIITVKPEMIKAVLVTLACMIIVCFVIIPSPFHTGLATLSVLSISYSLLGALGWWGQDTDPITMVNVLMAIGFSVDFSAHICYHYWHQDRVDRELGVDDDPKMVERRLMVSLSSVGQPMIEAAFSTVICMLPLFFVHIYVVMAFAKTVFCVGMLGLLHGLFIVPVVLTLPSPRQLWRRRRDSAVDNSIRQMNVLRPLTAKEDL